MMPTQVFEAVSMVESVTTVKVELCWEPAWTVADLSKRGKSVLELMDIDIEHMVAKMHDNTTGITFSRTEPKSGNNSK